MASVGYISLLLALVASIYSAIAFIFGKASENRQSLINGASIGILVAAGFISLSSFILIVAFLTHNFQIEYVYQYSNVDTPLAYLISGLWAGNDGSLLFWAWLLSVFAAIIVFRNRKEANDLLPYALTVTLIVQVFFLALLIVVSNPFKVLPSVPLDGRGLNPLLENPGMIIHPPALLAGYVAFTIPFAFAISSMLSRKSDTEWIISVRKWAIAAWLLLGLGNILGAWWAYYELGWGGFWGWDPVENAGLMPWLVGTAFLHSVMVQRRKGMLKIWNKVLIILAFTLSIFGTFLTRSGVLSSVHAFSNTGLGIFFLVFIVLILIFSFGLLYYRRKELKSKSVMDSFVSRESAFLLNNLLFIVGTSFVLLGTTFPILSEAFIGTKIVLKAPFFNKVNGPVFLAVILLIGICSLIGWQKITISNLLRKFLWPLVFAFVVVVLLIIFGVTQAYAVTSFFVCAFVLSVVMLEWLKDIRARRRSSDENCLAAFFSLLKLNRTRYGGYMVHIAMILITLGVVGITFYSIETETVLRPGETVQVGSYSLLYDNLESSTVRNRTVDSATIIVSRNGKTLGILNPEKQFDKNFGSVTEVDIRSTLVEDLYVILLASDSEKNAAFRIFINPLVKWMWIGGYVFLLGGLVALWPSRQQVSVIENNEDVG